MRSLCLPARCVEVCWSGVRRMARCTVWLVMGLLFLSASSVKADVVVTEVALSAQSNGQGYVMRVRTDGRVEAYSIPQRVDTHELEWVIYNATLHEDYEAPAEKGPVTGYEMSRRNGHLVFRIQLVEDEAVAATAYRDGASNDLLLNLAYLDRGPVARASPSPSGSTNPQSGSSDDPLAGVNPERSRLDTVVIDPGHGGKDPGATANGIREKDVVLDVAHKLGDYIENRLDIEVIYTRQGDRFIELEERGHFANRKGGDLFISIHANAAPSAPSAQGTETYFLGRAKTDAARRVMRRENSVVRRYEEDPDRYDEYDEEAFVRGELFLSASMQFSEQFASLVQKQFKHRVHRRDRGVHQANFYVLWSASMPSVLVELGFLTNSEEARFLESDQGQVYLASAIFRAVRDYEQQYNKGIAASE